MLGTRSLNTLCLKAKKYLRAVQPTETEMCFSDCWSRESASLSQAEVAVMKYLVFEARLCNETLERGLWISFFFSCIDQG